MEDGKKCKQNGKYRGSKIAVSKKVNISQIELLRRAKKLSKMSGNSRFADERTLDPVLDLPSCIAGTSVEIKSFFGAKNSSII